MQRVFPKFRKAQSNFDLPKLQSNHTINICENLLDLRETKIRFKQSPVKKKMMQCATQAKLD
jgi:hypothetical protein